MMGQGSSDGGVGGLHHLIQSSAPWGSWQEALKGWRNAAEFGGHNWAAPEPSRRSCLRSPHLQQPSMVLTEAAGTVASRIGHSSLAALWLEVEASWQCSVGWLFMGSRVPHSPNPMMLFSGRISDRSLGNGKRLCHKDGTVHVPSGCVWGGWSKLYEKSSSGKVSLPQAVTTVWKRILCKGLASKHNITMSSKWVSVGLQLPWRLTYTQLITGSILKHVSQLSVICIKSNRNKSSSMVYLIL